MPDNRQGVRGQGLRVKNVLLYACCLTLSLLFAIHILSVNTSAFAEDLSLQVLIDEALRNSPEILASGARAEASTFRIPQAKSLPDPMFMFGYQNEGYRRYTYGEMPGAQWMFSASQMFPFPGKLPLKGEMAARDSESLKEMYQAARLNTIARIKELFFDLFLVYRSIDLVNEKTALFMKIEDASLARYSTGMAPQQEVLMAQTEKYMLTEREEMLRQRIQTIEGMLNAVVGRSVQAPLGRPQEPVPQLYQYSLDVLIRAGIEHSPEIHSRRKMIAAAEAKVKMAQKEYYPDFTLAASLFKRTGGFEDMWSLTTTINIPIFYRTKQRMALLEAEAGLSEARHELEAAKFMVSSGIRENYSMLMTSEKLMELYKKGLVPKTYQDFEQAVSGYITGRVEAITVISRLKFLIDYELLFWEQFAQREKAIARLEALTGSNAHTIAPNVQGDVGK